MNRPSKEIGRKQRHRGRKQPSAHIRKSGLRAGITAGSAMSLMMAMGANARADTYTVLNNNNDGADSLRAAIGLANGNPGPDIIDFDVTLNGQTIDLNSELFITDPVDIVGPGADMLTIDANQTGRVFNIDGSASPGIDVSISGLTLTGGAIEGASIFGGGAILGSETDLTLTDSTITGNLADGDPASDRGTGFGGGVAIVDGSLTVHDSAISNNTAGQVGDGVESNGIGGGIFATSAGVAIYDSTVSGNTAANTEGYYVPIVGGGVAVFTGNLTIVRSTISGNVAGNVAANDVGIGFGGGVAIVGYDLLIEESTISGNVAGDAGTVSSGTYGAGGGIIALFANATIVNSTISGNTAGDGGTPDGGYGGGFGGGVALSSGDAVIISSTIAGNLAIGDADSAGGGMAADGSEGVPELHNTIVAENSALDGPDMWGDFSVDYSLIQDPNGHTIVNSPVMLINGPAGLSPLASNGGPTETHAITEASQAFNAGDAGNCALTDQRGITRPQLGGCDMGAFELAVSISDLLEQFDDAVDAGDLEGAGNGNSAEGRLGALRNMLVNTGNLLDMGDVPGACVQLLDAYNRTDGETPPKDFVVGAGADDLAAAIQDVRSSLGCE